MKKILHIANNSKLWPNKFVPEYSKLISTKDITNKHIFLYIGDGYLLPFGDTKSIVIKKDFLGVYTLLKNIFNSDKIVLHTFPSGIYSIIVSILLFMPYFKMKKIFAMVLWGGEIHFNISLTIKRKFLSLFHRVLMKKMDGFITYLEEDYKKACETSGNNDAKFLDLGGFYPSNIVNSSLYTSEYSYASKNQVNVLIGSSALKRNNHIEIIDTIPKSNVKLFNVKFFIPLSYGDDDAYSLYVEQYALDNLGKDSVVIIKSFMAANDYLRFLSGIDIAIFAHQNQQGMGNILNLLGFGADVYLNPDSLSWSFLLTKGFDVYDYNHISFSKNRSKKNSILANELFSLQRTITLQSEFYSSDFYE